MRPSHTISLFPAGGTHLVAILSAALCLSPTLHANDVTRYRMYALGSRLTEVLATSGAPAADVKTPHDRPTVLQTVEWRVPYTSSEALDADPVDTVTFAFVGERLYQIAVEYDRPRIAGLTTDDLVAGVSSVYGVRVAGSARGGQVDVPEDAVVLARWMKEDATVTLVRTPHGDVRLLLRSIPLGALATSAIESARALDLAEAPARRAASRAATAAEQQAERNRNRSAFRP